MRIGSYLLAGVVGLAGAGMGSIALLVCAFGFLGAGLWMTFRPAPRPTA